MRLKYLLLFILLFSVLAFGCGKEKVYKADPEIESAVKGYCESLIPTYNTLDAKHLQGYATEKEMSRIGMIILQFTGEKKFMESEMKEFKVVKVQLKDAKNAAVETFEKWRYRHLRKGTKEVIKPWIDAEYKLQYHMVKEDGKWLVEKTEFLK